MEEYRLANNSYDDVNLTVQNDGDPSGSSITLMIYMAADNNLWDDAVSNLAALEVAYAGSGASNVDIYILYDNTKAGQNCVYQLTGGTGGLKNVLNFTVNPDTGSEVILGAFVDYVTTKTDSDLYGLLLWDHGDGIRGAMTDEYAGSGPISVPGLVGAVAGKGIDVIGFDACLMASAEMAIELKDSGVHYLVASEELEGGAGWNYGMLPVVQNATSAAGLANALFLSAKANPDSVDTISLIDLHGASALEAGLNAFAREALALSAGDFNKLVAAAKASIWYGCYPKMKNLKDYVATDLADFLTRVLKKFNKNTTEIGRIADLLLQTVQLSVVENYTSKSYRGSGGISVFLPLQTTLYSQSNRFLSGLALNRNSSPWSNFLRRMAKVPYDQQTVLYRNAGLGVANVAEETNAYDLGGFTSGGYSFDEQILFADEELYYALTLADDQSYDASDYILITAADSAAELSFVLYSTDGTALTQCAAGSGETGGTVKIGLDGLAAGDYVFSVLSGTDTYFSISYFSDGGGAVDRFDLAAANDAITAATVLASGYHIALLTSELDPDFYLADFGRIDVDTLYIVVDGGDGSELTVTLYNEGKEVIGAAA